MLADLLVALTLKVTLALTAACTLTCAMKRCSAASRHLVWTLALVSMLVLPAAHLVGPRWDLAVLPVDSPENMQPTPVERTTEPPSGVSASDWSDTSAELVDAGRAGASATA